MKKVTRIQTTEQTIFTIERAELLEVFKCYIEHYYGFFPYPVGWALEGTFSEDLDRPIILTAYRTIAKDGNINDGQKDSSNN